MAADTDTDEGDDAVFTPKGLAVGIGFGLMFGMALGVALENIALWLPTGLGIGIAFAVALSRELDGS
jgi:hypothetical protein